jgi:hypothetical protein
MATEVDMSATGLLARERIAVNAGAALLVAGLLLVIAVLPAEYGVDPSGIGRRLGLTAMGDIKKLYSWKATGRVNYELHAEPDGAPRGYAESYEKRNAQDTASGTLTAPFSGIHGWYWENPGTTELTVTLSAAGFYNMSHDFRKNALPKTKMFR